jgi:N-acetyltransferase
VQFSIQPILENEFLVLQPLLESDFDLLFAVASDAKIWEQHPQKNRWQKSIFENYFAGAIASQGAFKIIDKNTNNIIGSTRFYDYNHRDNSILIGYTFYATKYWGKGINIGAKVLMLDYIFQFVDQVLFHIGASNIRSQMAIAKLNAELIDRQDIAYSGEALSPNNIYRIYKSDWLIARQASIS